MEELFHANIGKIIFIICAPLLIAYLIASEEEDD
jgi:hypothetical protein